ncbi:aldolase [Microvirga sp. BT689]|uniref:3-oxo-tetronate 4-phosphate decarboxylase n=1 Tax=Microvirga arvi TaxID=2778731 RepID=UPI0019522EAC|nr:3-oxo-tetronate 4-phosphate decarboxylase [Microvirga arvi]MBM6580679.1 aldolase [Microvirga arvi]
MSHESELREMICRFGRSLFERGLTAGSSGNISVRLSDGGWLTTPTNSSLGFLDPGRLSKLDEDGRLLSGDAPTKELPLHSALYATRKDAGAIVHLHSTHSVAVSMLPDIDPANVLPPMTAYYVMRVGRTALVPYYRPGDPAVTDAIRGLAGRYSSVLLANHGPVVAGKDLEAAVYATEELEETAKLRLLLHGLNPRLLSRAQVRDLVTHFDLDGAILDESPGNAEECCTTPHHHSHKCG